MCDPLPMRIPIFQVDAFTSRVFGGNPAAVCPLDRWLPDALLQAIGNENNLSETAFFVPADEGYELRWFTPAVEVDLCGHATLATAHVLFTRLAPELDEVRFQTKSGQVSVTRRDELLELDFPVRMPRAAPPDSELFAALGGVPRELLSDGSYTLVRYGDEAAIRALAPDMGALTAGTADAVCVTAPGDKADFVSRFFAPKYGVPEDPVTGSAHCASAPFWAERLGKNPLVAHQVSTRGGELLCEVRGDRVGIAGRAVLYLEGEIEVPDA